jgi:hypothetical protein
MGLAISAIYAVKQFGHEPGLKEEHPRIFHKYTNALTPMRVFVVHSRMIPAEGACG